MVCATKLYTNIPSTSHVDLHLSYFIIYLKGSALLNYFDYKWHLELGAGILACQALEGNSGSRGVRGTLTSASSCSSCHPCAHKLVANYPRVLYWHNHKLPTGNDKVIRRRLKLFSHLRGSETWSGMLPQRPARWHHGRCLLVSPKIRIGDETGRDATEYINTKSSSDLCGSCWGLLGC